MTQVSVDEAQARLPDLLTAVAAGETVLIRTDQGRIFQLSAPTPGPAVNPAWAGFPHPGSARGLIQIADTFDEPLDELQEYTE